MQINTQGVALPKLVLPVFGVYPELPEYIRMIFHKVIPDLLRRVFQKVPLYILPAVAGLHLPDQMDVVGHDNKGIDRHTFATHQEAQAFCNNILVFVRLEQWSPLQYGGCKKLRVRFG